MPRKRHFACKWAEHIRLGTAETPEAAFREAFGRGIPAEGRYKALDAATLRSDAKRIRALKDADGWQSFPESSWDPAARKLAAIRRKKATPPSTMEPPLGLTLASVVVDEPEERGWLLLSALDCDERGRGKREVRARMTRHVARVLALQILRLLEDQDICTCGHSRTWHGPAIHLGREGCRQVRCTCERFALG